MRRTAELHIAVRGNADTVGKKNIIQRGRRDILREMKHILLRAFNTVRLFHDGDFEFARNVKKSPALRNLFRFQKTFRNGKIEFIRNIRAAETLKTAALIQCRFIVADPSKTLFVSWIHSFFVIPVLSRCGSVRRISASITF